jgi:AraC-like protein
MNSAKDRIKIWHPWPLKQLELLQGTMFTNPYCQRFAQSYVIGTVQSGRGVLQYRNTKQGIARGAFYVIEPGEVWGCQSEELTFYHLLVDPALLQRIAAELLGAEKPWSHFPGPGLRDTSLSLIFEHLYAGLTASASQLEQQELLARNHSRNLPFFQFHLWSTGTNRWQAPLGRTLTHRLSHFSRHLPQK